MDFTAIFTRRTTSGQRTVAAWTLIVMFVVCGILGFCLAPRAGTPEQAATLRMVGYWGTGLALALYGIKWLIARFVD